MILINNRLLFSCCYRWQTPLHRLLRLMQVMCVLYLNLGTSVIQPQQKYEIQQVRHKTAFSLMADGLQATYLHRGVIKAALSSHLCSRRSSEGRRFLWLYHICFHDAAIIPLRRFSGPLHLITHWLCFSKNENVPFISFIFTCLQVFLKHTGRRQSDEYLIWANVEKWILKNE